MSTSVKRAGKRTWYIPDAYNPSSGQGEKWESHDCVSVLNVGDQEANIRFSFFFEDGKPKENVLVTVPGRQCKHVQMNRPELLGGYVVPRDVPYAIMVESDVQIIVQYSRMDVAQPNMTLMTAIPYCE